MIQNKKRKKVRFKPQYKILSWNPDKNYKQEKSMRNEINQRIDMRPQNNIEEELIYWAGYYEVKNEREKKELNRQKANRR